MKSTMFIEKKTKRASLFILLSLLLTALFSTTALAATYYVSPSGSDSGPGNQSQPWRTIAKASSTMVAGDTVYIMDGTYRERLNVSRSGSSGKYITYSAYPGHSPVIDGSGISLGSWQGLVTVSNRDYIKINGLKIQNAKGNQNSPGILVEDSGYVQITKNHTYNSQSSGIGVWSSNNVTVDDNEVELACNDGLQECITVAITSNFTISNNYVHDSGPGGNGGEGIDIKHGSNNGKVYNNHVENINRLGIYVDAWDRHTYNIEIYKNFVRNADHGFVASAEAGGLLENIKYYNNIAVDNREMGMWITPWGNSSNTHPMRNVQIFNNTFYSNGNGWGGGIYLDNPEASGTVICNNIVSGNRSFQIAARSGVSSANYNVSYNLIDGYRGGSEEVMGTHYIQGDPEFKNPSNNDFSLQATSPAIDNGTSSGAPSDDYNGQSRSAGDAPDIGAFEYGGAAAPTDSDGDGISDQVEGASGCLDSQDADTDDDGIPDGQEDKNHNGQVDSGETDPCNPDTDGDGIQDGTEIGLTLGDVGKDTDLSVFQPDQDPTSTTNPTREDTDGDGLTDGEEDLNFNGRVDQGEQDPTQNGDGTQTMASPTLISPTDQGTISGTSAVLKWSAVAGATQYAWECQYADGPLQSGTANTTTAQVSNLEPGKTYYWRVQAKNTTEASAWSAVWQFQVAQDGGGAGELTVPALSSPAANSTIGGTSVTLAWQSVSAATRYRWQAGLYGQGDSLNGTSDTNSVKVTGLTPGKTYWWMVRAENSSGYGSWSSYWKFTVPADGGSGDTGGGDPDPTVPSAPSLKSPASNGNVTGTSVTLEWYAASGATEYIWQATYDANGEILQGTVSGTSTTLNGLIAGKAYWWRVAAKNSAGQSNWSSVWKFQVADNGGDTGGGDTGGGDTGGGDTGGGDTGGGDTGGGDTGGGDTGGGDTGGGDTGGGDTGGGSGDTEPATLSVPTMVSPAKNATVGSNVTLKWNSVSGATQYRWQAGPYGKGDTMGGTTSSTSVSVNGLDPGKYWWMVRAENSKTYSSWPSYWKFTVK